MDYCIEEFEEIIDFIASKLTLFSDKVEGDVFD